MSAPGVSWTAVTDSCDPRAISGARSARIRSARIATGSARRRSCASAARRARAGTRRRPLGDPAGAALRRGRGTRAVLPQRGRLLRQRRARRRPRRAREAFGVALGHFARDDESGWRARAPTTWPRRSRTSDPDPEDLVEAVGLFDEALSWRTVEREIARGVTLHNLGLALRRLAELEPARAVDHLEESGRRCARRSRSASGTASSEGRALSERHLAVSLACLGQTR